MATAIGYIAESGCCAADDISDACSVAPCLHIKHYVWNFQELFQKEVIAPFISAYEKGETPNPCINCNRAIKFGALLERAREMDYDFLATGHYARVLFNKETGRYPSISAANPSYHGISFADAVGEAAFVTYIQAILLHDTGAGSIFTFEIDGGKEKAWQFIDALELFSLLDNDAFSIDRGRTSRTGHQCHDNSPLDRVREYRGYYW